jgi:hypothetical protein
VCPNQKRPEIKRFWTKPKKNHTHNQLIFHQRPLLCSTFEWTYTEKNVDFGQIRKKETVVRNKTEKNQTVIDSVWLHKVEQTFV